MSRVLLARNFLSDLACACAALTAVICIAAYSASADAHQRQGEARISIAADVHDPANEADLADYREMVDRYLPRGNLPSAISIWVAKSAKRDAGPVTQIPVVDAGKDAAGAPVKAHIRNIAANYRDYPDDYYALLDSREGRAQILMHEIAHVLLTTFLHEVYGDQDQDAAREVVFPLSNGRQAAILYARLVEESFADAFALMIIERRDGPGATDHYRQKLVVQRKLDAAQYRDHVTHGTTLALERASAFLASIDFHLRSDAELLAKALEISLTASGEYLFQRQLGVAQVVGAKQHASHRLADYQEIARAIEKLVDAAQRALSSFQHEHRIAAVRLPEHLEGKVALSFGSELEIRVAASSARGSHPSGRVASISPAAGNSSLR